MDPVANMLSSIKNAQKVNKEFIIVPSSKIKMGILEILKQSGYILSYERNNGEIKITLSYKNDKAAISDLKRVSKPGRRVYVKKAEIPSVLSGHGIAVLSTPKGVMTGGEARKRNLGGELLLEIW